MQLFNLDFCNLYVDSNEEGVEFSLDRKKFFIAKRCKPMIEDLLASITKYVDSSESKASIEQYVSIQSEEVLGCSLTLGELYFLREVCNWDSVPNLIQINLPKGVKCFIRKTDETGCFISKDSYAWRYVDDLLDEIKCSLVADKCKYLILRGLSKQSICLDRRQQEVLYYALAVILNANSWDLDKTLREIKRPAELVASGINSSHFKYIEQLYLRGRNTDSGLHTLAKYICTYFDLDISPAQIDCELAKFFYSEEVGNHEIFYILFSKLWGISIDRSLMKEDILSVLIYASSIGEDLRSAVVRVCDSILHSSIKVLGYLER